jgi:glycosyltransferase involved in cell wall biosynthesis
VRVLHIQKVRGIGGSERHLLTLLPALARAGMDVRMCALVAGDGDAFVAGMQAAGVETVAIPAGPDLNPLALVRVADHVHRTRPDLVHTHLVHGDLYGQLAALGLRVPAVSSVHSTPSYYRRVPFQQCGRLSGRLTDWRIAISEHVRSFVLDLDLGRADRTRVVYYGIDAHPWGEATARRRTERQRYGLEPGDVAVGIAARLIEGKGHRVLLDAVRQLRADVPTLRLLIAGDGPIAADLRRAAEGDEGVVRFLGFVEDVPGFMSACDICAFPTEAALSEGFGLSALEAMAAGLPVVATTVGSLPEVVVNGETGLLVEPSDAFSLAGALARLATDATLRASLGANGARRATTRFSLGQMIDGTLEVYQDATDG